MDVADDVENLEVGHAVADESEDTIVDHKITDDCSGALIDVKNIVILQSIFGFDLEKIEVDQEASLKRVFS